MPLGEFELIERYFTRPVPERQGVGDDCALIDVGGAGGVDLCLAITTDMLLEHVHFLAGADAEALGHKALAVNLSDLAAAGARPRCFTLAIALPAADPDWLEPFARGLFGLADRYACALVGGDTTRSPRIDARPGPIALCITAIGEIERDRVRGRSGARPGDEIWVSGTLGDAALALAEHRGQVLLAPAEREACRARMDRPTPRVELGRALLGLASAAIDVSDGLLGDLAHILARSGVGATVRLPDLPRSPAVARQDAAMQQYCVLAGGDDYELLFTAPRARRADLLALARDGGLALTAVGEIRADGGLQLLGADGAPIQTKLQAFDHFAASDGG